jgi:spermidine/putrescine-binding protein
MSELSMNRRRLLGGTAALAGASALPLARFAFAQQKAIKVATWGGSWRDSLDKTIGSQFKAQASVEYVVDTPQGNLAKLGRRARARACRSTTWKAGWSSCS